MYRKTIPALVLSGCLAMTPAWRSRPFRPRLPRRSITSAKTTPCGILLSRRNPGLFHSRPFSRTQPDTFDEEPDLESETAGKLSGESVENALNTLNFIRYIAGISADVETSDYYENMAMAGAAL